MILEIHLKYYDIERNICIMISTLTINVADKFNTEWVLQYGAPYYAISDNAENLAGDVFSFSAKMFGFRQLTTLYYNAKGDGKIERKFRDIKQDLSMKFQEAGISWNDIKAGVQWELWLKGLQCNANNQMDSAMKISPFEHVYGQPMNLPIDIKLRYKKLHRELDNTAGGSKFKARVAERICMLQKNER